MEKSACSLVPRADVLETLRIYDSDRRSITRSASDSLNLSVCRFTGPGVNIRITVDTAPDVRRRYFNRITEQQLSSVHGVTRRPHPIEDLGDEDAYGPAGAYWIPAFRQLFALSGERLLIVGFSVRGLEVKKARAAAERLARLALDRPKGSGSGPESDTATVSALDLTIISPVDGELVRAPRVTVHGTISGRNARVRVAGRSVELREGIFAGAVPVKPGRNRITVVALGERGQRKRQTVTVRRGRSAQQLGTAFARRRPGVVPDVLGERLDMAEAILRNAALRFRRVEISSGPVVAREWTVCTTRPPPGARIRAHEAIVLLIDHADIYRSSGTACAQQ